MAHWIDSDVLINAWNDALGPDFAPGFWDFLVEGLGDGRFKLADAVKTEIDAKDDALRRWVQALPRGCIVDPNANVQAAYTPIADHVRANGYVNERKFLAGADAWVIAHASVDRGIVVSQEVRTGPGGREAKVPNIADRFGVQSIRRDQFLRNFGVRLVRG